jgi:hypothetical protein
MSATEVVTTTIRRLSLQLELLHVLHLLLFTSSNSITAFLHPMLSGVSIYIPCKGAPKSLRYIVLPATSVSHLVFLHQVWYSYYLVAFFTLCP